jgi:hypothetical protein
MGDHPALPPDAEIIGGCAPRGASVPRDPLQNPDPGGRGISRRVLWRPRDPFPPTQPNGRNPAERSGDGCSRSPAPGPGGARPGHRGSFLVSHGLSPLSTSAHPPRRSPKPQYWRDPARCLAAQGISAFSTGLTARPAAANVGGCANGPRIACGAGPLRGRRHHSLVTPIDWKLRCAKKGNKIESNVVTTRW